MQEKQISDDEKHTNGDDEELEAIVDTDDA